MARVTNRDLQETIDRLQAENAELKERAERAESAADAERADARRTDAGGTDSAGAGRAPKRRKRGWGWTVLATALIAIGSLLAPVAVVSTWAQRELTDTDYFVSTFGPLVENPAVQSFITDQTVSAIDAQVDIQQLTTNVFDGIAGLGLGPTASAALKALATPAAQGIKQLMHNTVSDFVSSASFATLWQQTLRTAHGQLGATMNGDQNAVITLASDGAVGLQLGPIITAVKKQLVAQGITFAANIPVISKTIVIAHTDSAALVQLAYGMTIALGTWLPWLVLVMLIAGVLVARRRSVALIWAAIGLALTTIALAAGVAIGRTIFIASVSGAIPAGAAGTIYADVLQFVQSIAVAVAVLAITVALVGYLAGPFGFPRRLRALTTSGFERARGFADGYGLSTGAVGRWLYRQRVLLRVAVAAIGAVIVVFVRPLTPPLIIWTAVLALLVIGILELLQRPDAAVSASPPIDA